MAIGIAGLTALFKMPKCEQTRRKVTLAIIWITISIATLDLFTDWLLFKDFFLYGGGKLTVPLGVFCAVSTILFVMEARNFVISMHFYRKSDTRSYAVTTPDGQNESTESEEQKLERWKETVSFLLLGLEDLPITVIMYVAFKKGSCEIFNRIFKDSFTGKLALLAAFFSSLWKGILSFRYCWNVCRCKYYDLNGPFNYFVCCCCRFLRPFVAIQHMSLAAYLYLSFNYAGSSARPECEDDDDDVMLTTVATFINNTVNNTGTP